MDEGLPDAAGTMPLFLDRLRGGCLKGLALTYHAADIYADIWTEREKAHAKHGDKSMESAPPDSMKRLRILLEEVGEIAREFNEADIHDRPVDLAALRFECIQVAAMAASWADACTRPIPPGKP